MPRCQHRDTDHQSGLRAPPGAASFLPDVLFGLQRRDPFGVTFPSCGVAAHFTSVKSGDHRHPHTTSKMKRPRDPPWGRFFWSVGFGRRLPVGLSL